MYLPIHMMVVRLLPCKWEGMLELAPWLGRGSDLPVVFVSESTQLLGIRVANTVVNVVVVCSGILRRIQMCVLTDVQQHAYRLIMLEW